MADNKIKYENKKLSIREELAEFELQLNDMEPVACLVVSEFAPMRKSDIAKIIDVEYKKFGNQVDRQHFGVVLLTFSQINKALEYLNTSAEYVAFYAVPHVIKRGIIINHHINHKERKVESITFAAPVEINGVRGNMGVVVQRIKGTSRYKTHRIIMPDGSNFEFKNK